MGRLSRDIAAVGRDLEDLEEPTRGAAELLAEGVRGEAPYVTGFLVSTVYTDDAGVGVGAVYAGVVHDSNPYAERAVERVDPLGPFVDYVDSVIDSHLQAIYV